MFDLDPKISDEELADQLENGLPYIRTGRADGGLLSKLNDRLEDVLIQLLGDPNNRETDEWRWGTKGSLSVNMNDKRGLWCDFENEVGGDIPNLLAREWELDPALDRDEIHQRADALLSGLPEERSQRHDQQKGKELDKWSAEEATNKYWTHGEELSDGHGRAYLSNRGLDPDEVPYAVAREAQHRSNKKAGTSSFPAIIFPLTDIEGEVVGVHAIRCPRGEKLKNWAKISHGRMKGAAIKLPGNKTDAGEIVIVEGPEDALSIWQATGLETRAVCSVGNISSAPVLKGECIVVIGDADEKTEEKTRAACSALAERCERVRLVFPDGDHKDANDILMADPDQAGNIYRKLIERAEEIEASHTVNTSAGLALNFSPVRIDEGFDPQSIPLREWQVGGLTMLGHMTLIVSPGAVGKSSFGVEVSVAVALGRNDMIPGHSMVSQGNVLLINGEDDQNELNRRLAGVIQKFDIAPGELDGKLFLQSFYGQTPRLAEYNKREDKVAPGHLVGELSAFCLANEIKLIIIDPLIGFHNVPESVNEAMEQVVSILRILANDTGAAVVVMHHTRKTGGNSEAHAGDAESGRGAVAMIWASRIAKTLARMSKDTAKRLKLEWRVGVDLRRIDDAKMNYARANEDTVWFRMKSVVIGNGESVPVPVAFDMKELAIELEADKKEDRKQTLKDQCSEVGVALLELADEGNGPQADIGAKLEPLLDVGSSTAQSRLKALPDGRADAHDFWSLGHRYILWRENIGSVKAPRYIVLK
jgi:RecA-family ATPase/phage/plasmid primase-like uncharacterized protein